MKKEKHLIVRSRNTTCSPLKEIVVPSTTILRLGSTTPTEKITKRPNPIEINTAEACAISGDKELMRKAFIENNIPIAEGIHTDDINKVIEFMLKQDSSIICKHIHSSKGKGIYLFKSREELLEWSKNHDVNKHIFERYYTYTREYRLHVTKDGCFYACRKMLKHDADVRWHRHNVNSVWFVEENLLFDKPTNWDSIVEDCVRALEAIGLDIAAFDIKVQSSQHKNPKYIILESNSAPSLGEKGLLKYKETLTKLINGKEFCIH
jgi:glutathione synthase/RimK-type ligase-like ATP-grasp enzyme